jgi:hypothetical protein
MYSLLEYDLIADRPPDMMKIVCDRRNVKLSRLSGRDIMRALSWLRAAILLLILALFLRGSSFAESARKASLEFARTLDSNGVQTLTLTGVIPGERPVYADFDGDDERDVAKGFLVDNHYEILVSLSTRSDVIILHSPVQLAGFTIHAFDINHDSYPDIVAISPTESHPLAVWLGDGKGNFKSADRQLFETDSGFRQSPEYQSSRLQPDPDTWTEPLYPVGEPAIAGRLILPTVLIGAIAPVLKFNSAREQYSRTAPRSPPVSSLSK